MTSQILGDRYEVQQQLAKKTGRRTLLARNLKTQELVVVKVLSFGSDFEWDALKLFEREAETLKALNHPSIPRYLDFFELEWPNSKGFALVQTYVAGKSLEEHLKAGRSFSESEVKQLAKALLEILIYLHGRQPAVIHRDIKPSNILLADRSGNSIGQVYLVDFGSVQTLAAKEGGTITVVGTYGYMPPEQFGDRAVPASDLYSLGATLITLVTGTHPADLPQKDFRIQFEQAANLSPAFTDWLRWMTEPSLDQRLTSAKEALQALEQQHSRNAALLVVSKPTGSKVRLNKKIHSLEILIPPTGFSPKIGFLCCFAIAWIAGVISWTSSVIVTPFFSMNLLFVLFSLPFWGVGIGMVIIILSTLFGRTRFCLNQQEIYSTYALFKVEHHPPRYTRRHNITKLEYLEGFYTINSGGERVEVKPQINIWAGTHKYELGSSILSEPELDWLAYELSKWLKMPIIKKNSQTRSKL